MATVGMRVVNNENNDKKKDDRKKEKKEKKEEEKKEEDDEENNEEEEEGDDVDKQKGKTSKKKIKDDNKRKKDERNERIRRETRRSDFNGYCNLCQDSYSNETAVLYHQSRSHRNRRDHVCSSCGRFFRMKQKSAITMITVEGITNRLASSFKKF